MKRVIFREPGGPDVLELIEVPEPTAGAGEGVRRKPISSASFTAYFGSYPQIYPQTGLALIASPGPF